VRHPSRELHGRGHGVQGSRREGRHQEPQLLCEAGERPGVSEVVEIRERCQRGPVFDFPVAGFEDCRLFFWRGRFWCSCTVRDMNPQGRCEIALLELDDDRCVVRVEVERSVHADRHQKNWMPLVRGDDLYFIYSTDPTTVLAYDPESARARVISERAPALALDHLRGDRRLSPSRAGGSA